MGDESRVMPEPLMYQPKRWRTRPSLAPHPPLRSDLSQRDRFDSHDFLLPTREVTCTSTREIGELFACLGNLSRRIAETAVVS